MRVIKPSFKIINFKPEEEILKKIELIGRTCYKSEDKITENSALDFFKKLGKMGHLSVFEHVSISVRIICDRGISHELVRHRIASYAQESTRYVDYSKDNHGGQITFIEPFFWRKHSQSMTLWKVFMQEAEDTYMDLLALGASAQEARTVLPNSTKTEIVITTNLREWDHIFSLRSSWLNKKAHPQMIEIMDQVRAGFQTHWPNIF